MEPQQPLFRAAAVAAQKHDGLGAIVLVRPISYAFLASLAAAVAGALIALACLASYTAHTTLRGRLVPERGVIDVTSQQPGTIVEKRVGEGDSVAAGDTLLVLSSERLMRSGAALEAAVGAELEQRRASLAAQIANTRRLEAMERAALLARRAALDAEAASLAEAVGAKRRRVALSERAVQRYADVRARGFLSEEQWALREAELLEQQSGLEALERESAALTRLETEVDERLATLQPRYANAIAELERALGGGEREIVENDARRATTVSAPQPGTVTGLAADVGQSVQVGTVLARIVPKEPKLVAELFAPSRAVGFVAVGDEVRLRYAAFPYQKFGHARGAVTSVSATTVAGDAALGVEPTYRVAVALESQAVTAYGAPRRLMPGMAVEADVLGERRRLYEWVLEPLYALADRIG
ncbi:MAG: HlyD family efflux transporter periplasmic adaptor subunit [Lysobacterales bacterium]|nr:MAG: HlyD family efflux transporter periplasmic adaptor subunit [Xanthomonadales bacterium]